MPSRRATDKGPGHTRGSAQKSFFRRIERTLDTIQHSDDILGTVRNVAEYMTANFKDELGIVGGRIYHLNEDEYVLVHSFGTAQNAPIGTVVSRHYVAIDAVLESVHLQSRARAAEGVGRQQS